MKMTTDITALKRRRTTIKSSCTRIKSFFESIETVTSEVLADLKVRKNRLDHLWEQYDKVQSEIEEADEREGADRIQFEKAFYSLSAKMNTALETSSLTVVTPSVPAPGTSNPNLTPTSNNNSHIRLPKLNLSIFTGSYEEWIPFSQLFKAMILDNESLSNTERFQYLKSSLSGEAADTIQSLDISDQNFTTAWSMLTKRYDKKRVIVQRHLQSIIDIPNIKKENYQELRNLLNTVNKHLNSLKSLNRPTGSWDDILIHLLVNKLDAKTYLQWEGSLSANNFPTMQQFHDFLSHRCETLESVHKRESAATSTTKNLLQNSARRSAITCTATVRPKCFYCNGEHPIYLCKTFLNLPSHQRLTEVRKRHICTNCLKSKEHQASQCSSGVCKLCNGKHNSLLHIPSSKGSDTKTDPQPKFNSTNEASTSAIVTHSSTSNSNYVLLSTAIIYVFDHSGKERECRVLLDNGSQANLISNNFLSELGLKSWQGNISINGINHLMTTSNQIVLINLKSRYNSFQTSVECVVTNQITDSLPAVAINKSRIKIPENIQLADPQFHVPGKIDMLLGANLFWQILCIGQIKPSLDNPTIQKTHFGWILAGSIHNPAPIQQKINNFFISSSDSLHDSLTKFWEVENIDLQNTRTPMEKVCEEHFLKTTTRNDEGRFIVNLPIKSNGLELLGPSKNIALKRFQGLERRLNKDSQLKSEYSGFMREYQNLGHMKEVIDTETFDPSIPNFYLPHHCVFKSSDDNKKIRVVFDGSSKTESGSSINDILMVGPTVQDDLVSLICRFRKYKYVFSADIIKMYRQILIDSSQTCLQRILWREHCDQPIKTFELQTVTYGTASASFLSTRCLNHLAELHRDQFPIGSNAVAHDFYVDDLLTGADTLAEAKVKRNEIISVLNSGKFILDKWASNHDSLIRDIPSLSQSHQPTAFNADINFKLLGLLWNPAEDLFCFCVKTDNSKSLITKRTMLSEISRMFDPLGLIGPVIVIAKLFIQELWQLSIDWDDLVPTETQAEWLNFKIHLSQLHQLRIPRWTLSDNFDSEVQFHGFADASQRAYGACCYLRVQESSGNYKVTLVASKSRIAPMKAISLPRLELCAALLLAQLSSKILNALNISSLRVFLWSDSSITLAWIRSSSRKWQTFIANRIGEIQRFTNIQDWHHISTEYNPADIISRGAAPQELINSQLWWQGPEWLKTDETNWPTSDISCSLENIPEQSTSVLTNIATDPSFINLLCAKYSSLGKLVRVLSYCKRFISNISPNSPRRTGSLTPEETQDSMHTLCKLVQGVSFSKEIFLLKQSKQLQTTSHILSLSPFCDEHEILRVGGRLKNSKLPYDTCHPILLPKNHLLSILIIRDAHIRNHHSGVQATIYSVRTRFWPLAIKNTTKRIIRRCIICFKSKPSISQALMGNLPAERIQPSRPFSHCGIDFGGPFHIKEHKRRGAKVSKCYIAVFICLAVKAVHIELVADLSAECFLASFKRFISRRGKPTCMYSDNGTNFVGAHRELRELYDAFLSEQTQSKIKNFVAESEIKWEFIPPHAPHYGGLWEAAIKSAKYHMKRILGDALLNYDEMSTILCEIECVLNSRPITALSNDPNDFQCLTPGHFLIGNALNGIPQPSILDIKINRLSQWQRIEQLRQHFWQRWSNEYLHQLQGRNKWKLNIGTQLQLGQLVLIQQPGLGPLQWIIGRISKVYPDSKGISRSADIQTNKGIVTRPLTKLAILPLE